MSHGPQGPAAAGGLRGIEAVPRRSRWLWSLPTLTFVAGLALGGLVVSLDGSGQQEAAPATRSPAEDGPAGAAEPSPSPSDLLVRVPEPCLAVADEAERAFAVFDRAVDAARGFDARRLQEVVDDVQQLRPRVEELADGCRDRAGQDLVDGATATSVPTPTPEP